MAATAAYMDTTTAAAAAASAAYMTTATSTAAAVTAATSTATTPAAAGHSQFLREWGRSGIFFVEDIECRQTDVGEFLLAKKELVTL
jgi:hypothetical protein